MTTTQDERRTAVRCARKLLAAPGINDEIKLICATLIDCQEAFVNRLAPVYSAALALVRPDGSQDAKAWFAFKDLVLKCKAHDRAASIEPHDSSRASEVT